MLGVLEDFTGVRGERGGSTLFLMMGGTCSFWAARVSSQALEVILKGLRHPSQGFEIT